MPTPEEFKKGFHIHNNMKISDDIYLNKIDITEEIIQQYREYKYNIKIELKINPDISINEIINNFSRYFNVNKSKIIKTHYGNNYECIFNYLNNNIYSKVSNNIIILYYTGHSKRI